MPIRSYDIDNGNRRKWIDITDPTNEELDSIGKEYAINRHVMRDCLEPDHLPKHENLKGFTFIIMRLIHGNIKQHLDSLQDLTTKIAIFYNEEYLITIHRASIPFLDELHKEAGEGNGGYSTANHLTLIIRHVLLTFEEPAMYLGGQLDNYESTVLLKHTKPALLQGLYYIKRKASACKKVLLLTDDLILFLKTTPTHESAVQDVRDLYTKLLMLYDQVLEDVTNLLSTYLSLTAQKTNEVMKVLTIFSVFFMPLTFIVGVYGMNFRLMPELQQEWGYPAVLILMFVISVSLFFWMRKKKWI